MKRILFALLSLLLAFSAGAEVVSREQAADYAGKFMTAQKGRKVEANELKMVRAGLSSGRFSIGDARLKMAVAVAKTPSYYVFNYPQGGWVIISAEDCVSPVLAYSDTGSFASESEQLPDNLQWWMDNLDAQIQSVRMEGVATDSPQWPLEPAAATEVLRIDTPLWDQGSPYNLLCPLKSGTRTITGCVATAAAIVCYHNRWPDAGEGTTPAYRGSYGRVSVPANTLGRTYDYDKMLTRYTSSATTAQKNAVAQLMYDLGCVCKMDYDTEKNGGSGAFTDDLVAGMAKYMKYDSNARCLARGSYTDANWIKLLKEEFNTYHHPILYGGYDSGPDGIYDTDDDIGGHQFIFDGYDSNNYFHVNWGWSGDCNGYFSITALGSYTTVGCVFSDYQDAVFGLIPLKPSTPDPGTDPEPDPSHTPEQIAAATSLTFDRASRKLSLTSSLALECIVKNASSQNVASKSLQAGVKTDIDMSSFAKGSYTISLKDTGEAFVFTFELL